MQLPRARLVTHEPLNGEAVRALLNFIPARI
jgi:hypothetical protein